jgi:hypothetical protein
MPLLTQILKPEKLNSQILATYYLELMGCSDLREPLLCIALDGMQSVLDCLVEEEILK